MDSESEKEREGECADSEDACASERQGLGEGGAGCVCLVVCARKSVSLLRGDWHSSLVYPLGVFKVYNHHRQGKYWHGPVQHLPGE